MYTTNGWKTSKSVVHSGIGFLASQKWMPERRDVTADPSLDIDYLLKAWLTKLDATFTGRGGFVGRVGFMSSNTSVPRGLGSMDITGDLDDEFYRGLVNFGWSFGNAIFVIGGAYDYHPRTTTWIWGTSSSRIIVRW